MSPPNIFPPFFLWHRGTVIQHREDPTAELNDLGTPWRHEQVQLLCLPGRWFSTKGVQVSQSGFPKCSLPVVGGVIRVYGRKMMELSIVNPKKQRCLVQMIFLFNWVIFRFKMWICRSVYKVAGLTKNPWKWTAIRHLKIFAQANDFPTPSMVKHIFLGDCNIFCRTSIYSILSLWQKIHSRKLTYPTWGKGTSSSKVPW